MNNARGVTAETQNHLQQEVDPTALNRGRRSSVMSVSQATRTAQLTLVVRHWQNEILSFRGGVKWVIVIRPASRRLGPGCEF
jgi:hypothetical protein